MKRMSPLLVIFLVVFFDLVAFGIIIPILPYYSKEFGANAFIWSLVMAIYSVAQFLFAPFWGNLSDSLGRRPILLLSILLGAISTAIMAFAQSVWWILACRLLAGIFAANISTASAYIADSTSEENRAKGMGIIGAGFGLGFIFGPAIGGLLSPYGLHVPILLAAALGFANFILGYFILSEPLRDLEQRKKNRRHYNLDLVREVLAYSPTRAPVLLFFIATLAFTQLEVSFGFYVLERFGYGARAAGGLLAMMGTVMVLIQGGGIGRLAKRFGEESLVKFAIPLMAVALVGSALSASVAVFSIFLVLIATANAIINPALSSLMSKAAKKENMGGMLGVYQSSSSLARIIGPPIAGAAYVRMGISSPMLLSSAVMAGGALLAWNHFSLRGK